MNRTIALLGTTLLVAAMAAPAAAGDGKGKLKRKAEVLKKYDANGNGVLDDAERAQLRADRKARRAKLKARFDTNGDGVLDAGERAAFRQAWRMQRADQRFDKLVYRLDRDGDRALSLAELQAAPRLKGKAGKMRRTEARFRMADTNRDGVVTRDEFRRAAFARKGKRGKKARRAQPAPAPAPAPPQ